MAWSKARIKDCNVIQPHFRTSTLTWHVSRVVAFQLEETFFNRGVFTSGLSRRLLAFREFLIEDMAWVLFALKDTIRLHSTLTDYIVPVTFRHCLHFAERPRSTTTSAVKKICGVDRLYPYGHPKVPPALDVIEKKLAARRPVLGLLGCQTTSFLRQCYIWWHTTDNATLLLLVSGLVA